MRKVLVLAAILGVAGVGVYTQHEYRRMQRFDEQMLAILNGIHQRAGAAIQDRTQAAALYTYLSGEALESAKALPLPDLEYRQVQLKRLLVMCQGAGEAFRSDPLNVTSEKALLAVQSEAIDIADCLRRGLISTDQPW